MLPFPLLLPVVDSLQGRLVVSAPGAVCRRGGNIHVVGVLCPRPRVRDQWVVRVRAWQCKGAGFGERGDDGFGLVVALYVSRRD